MADDKKPEPTIGYADERARNAYDLTITHWLDQLQDLWQGARDPATPGEEIKRQKQMLATPPGDIALPKDRPRDVAGRFLPVKKVQPIGGPSRSYRASPEDLAAARAKDLAARYPTLAEHLATARPTAEITARGAPGYNSPWDRTATWWRHARENYPVGLKLLDLPVGGLFDPDVTYGPADWAMAAAGPMEGMIEGAAGVMEHAGQGLLKRLEGGAENIAKKHVLEHHATRGAAQVGTQHASPVMSKMADWGSRGLYAKDELAAEQETGEEQPVPRYEEPPSEEQDLSEPEFSGEAPVITPSREEELAVARQRAYEKARQQDQLIRQMQSDWGPSVRDLYRRRVRR